MWPIVKEDPLTRVSLTLSSECYQSFCGRGDRLLTVQDLAEYLGGRRPRSTSSGIAESEGADP